MCPWSPKPLHPQGPHHSNLLAYLSSQYRWLWFRGHSIGAPLPSEHLAQMSFLCFPASVRTSICQEFSLHCFSLPGQGNQVSVSMHTFGRIFELRGLDRDSLYSFRAWIPTIPPTPSHVASALPMCVHHYLMKKIRTKSIIYRMNRIQKVN